MFSVAQSSSCSSGFAGVSYVADSSARRFIRSELAGWVDRSAIAESSDVQAKRISVAAQRLDVVVQSCRADANVDGFANDLGKLTLEATGLGKP